MHALMLHSYVQAYGKLFAVNKAIFKHRFKFIP